MKMVVTINGTFQNPWTKMNLTRNPFPQLPYAELQGAMMQLNSLDADPIPADNFEAEIDRRLEGWSEEFRDACKSMYKPGQRTRFSCDFPAPPWMHSIKT